MEHRLDIRWTRSALRRLDEIVETIARDDPAAAWRVAKLIRDGAEMLRRFPFVGRESLRWTRELVVHRNYLVSYRARQGRNGKQWRLEIVQVWHVAQNR